MKVTFDEVVVKATKRWKEDGKKMERLERKRASFTRR